MSILSLRRLTVMLSGTRIVHDLTFHIEAGERIGLLGPNGSGKSTTLHAIVGLVPVHSGSISVVGHDHASRAAKNEFGFLPDDLPMPDALTGGEYLTLLARLRGRQFDRDLSHELAVVLDISRDLNKPIAAYSHGMRRKVSLIGALAHNPSLLILDEPMRGLDPVAASLLSSLLFEWPDSNGRSLLAATHDLSSASESFDRLLVINAGSLVCEGTPRDIMARYQANSLESAFMTATGLDRQLVERQGELRRLLELKNPSRSTTGSGSA